MTSSRVLPDGVATTDSVADADLTHAARLPQTRCQKEYSITTKSEARLALLPDGVTASQSEAEVDLNSDKAPDKL